MSLLVIYMEQRKPYKCKIIEVRAKGITKQALRKNDARYS